MEYSFACVLCFSRSFWLPPLFSFMSMAAQKVPHIYSVRSSTSYYHNKAKHTK